MAHAFDHRNASLSEVFPLKQVQFNGEDFQDEGLEPA